MKFSTIALGAAAMLALGSCDKNDEQASEAAKSISVNTHIGPMTRVATNGNSSVFEDGDKISVYAWTGTADLVNTSGMVVNNAINTLNGTKWTPEPMMKWTDMTTPHFFLSVYPDRSITNFTTDAVKVDPAKQMESDLLVAVNTGAEKKGLIATNNPVSLNFDHMMSMLVVQFTYRDEFSEIPLVTSVSTEATCDGTIDYLQGIITPTGDSVIFGLPVVKANEQYASVILPQAIQQVTVVINGKNYIYTHPTPLILQKGKIQTIKLIVGRNRIELDQVTISDWVNELPIEGGEAVD